MPHPGAFEPVAKRKVHIADRILVGQAQRIGAAGKDRARFKLQDIGAQVRDIQRQRRVRALRQARLRLPRHAEHQIDRKVFDPAAFRRTDRALHVGKTGGPAEPAAFGVNRRLHAHGRPVETGGSQDRKERVRVSEARVHLRGDLRVRRKAVMPTHGVKHFRELFRRQRRRRAAAEIDAFDLPPLQVRRDEAADPFQGLQLPAHGGNVSGFGPVVRAQRIEIAVRAFGPAERDMDVDPEGGVRSGHLISAPP